MPELQLKKKITSKSPTNKHGIHGSETAKIRDNEMIKSSWNFHAFMGDFPAFRSNRGPHAKVGKKKNSFTKKSKMHFHQATEAFSRRFLPNMDILWACLMVSI